MLKSLDTTREIICELPKYQELKQLYAVKEEIKKYLSVLATIINCSSKELICNACPEKFCWRDSNLGNQYYSSPSLYFEQLNMMYNLMCISFHISRIEYDICKEVTFESYKTLIYAHSIMAYIEKTYNLVVPAGQKGIPGIDFTRENINLLSSLLRGFSYISKIKSLDIKYKGIEPNDQDELNKEQRGNICLQIASKCDKCAFKFKNCFSEVSCSKLLDVYKDRYKNNILYLQTKYLSLAYYYLGERFFCIKNFAIGEKKNYIGKAIGYLLSAQKAYDLATFKKSDFASNISEDLKIISDRLKIYNKINDEGIYVYVIDPNFHNDLEEPNGKLMETHITILNMLSFKNETLCSISKTMQEIPKDSSPSIMTSLLDTVKYELDKLLQTYKDELLAKLVQLKDDIAECNSKEYYERFKAAEEQSNKLFRIMMNAHSLIVELLKNNNASNINQKQLENANSELANENQQLTFDISNINKKIELAGKSLEPLLKSIESYINCISEYVKDILSNISIISEASSAGILLDKEFQDKKLVKEEAKNAFKSNSNDNQAQLILKKYVSPKLKFDIVNKMPNHNEVKTLISQSVVIIEKIHNMKNEINAKITELEGLGRKCMSSIAFYVKNGVDITNIS